MFELHNHIGPRFDTTRPVATICILNFDQWTAECLTL